MSARLITVTSWERDRFQTGRPSLFLCYADDYHDEWAACWDCGSCSYIPVLCTCCCWWCFLVRKCPRKISFKERKKKKLLTVDPANGKKPSPAQVVRPIGKLLVYVVSNDTLAFFWKIWRLVDYSPTNQLHPHQYIPHPKKSTFWRVIFFPPVSSEGEE
jgi:hypothetical protein